MPYKVDDTSWGLLGSELAEEQKSLSGLGSPGGVVVADLLLLATEVVAQVLGLDRSVSQPEVVLLEAGELPVWFVSSCPGYQIGQFELT